MPGDSVDDQASALWQELELRFLPHWQARWGDLPIDSRQRMLALLMLRNVKLPLQEEDLRALGPLLCDSPNMQKEYLHWLQLPANGFVKPASDRNKEKDQPKADTSAPAKNKPEFLWFWSSLPVILLLVLLSWVIWPEIFLSKVNPQKVALPIESTIKPPSAGKIESSDYLTPIELDVVLPQRSVPVGFLSEELPQLLTVRDDWRWAWAALLGGLFFGLWRLLAGRALRQTQTRIPVHQKWLGNILTDVPVSPALLPEPSAENLAAMHYKRQPADRLDVRETVKASAKRGVVDVRFGTQQRRRRFILLLPRPRSQDWRHDYLSDVADQLAGMGIELNRYYYRHTPSQLFAVESPDKGINLEQLDTNGAAVLAVVGRDAVWHPDMGVPLSWLGSMQGIDDHLLLFDEGLAESSGLELQALGVNALSLSSADELQQLFSWMVEPGPNLVYGDAPKPLPYDLQRTADPAFYAYPPSEDKQERVVNWIKTQLPEPAFDLLCAAVVFPNPEWRLVWCLAQRLPRDELTKDIWPHKVDKLGVGSIDMLRPLVQLPWSQHRFYPFWLRVRLANMLAENLGEHFERNVALLYGRLLEEGRHQGASAIPLNVDVPQGGWRNRLAALRQQGPLRDALFASAYTRSRLAQLLPRWLRRRLRQGKLAWGEWWQAGAVAIVGAVLAGLGAYALWQGVGEEGNLQQRIAARLAANQQQRVQIRYNSDTQDIATWVRATLNQHGYTVDGFESDNTFSNTGQGVLADQLSDTAQLRAPADQLDTLQRLIREALYGAKVAAFVLPVTSDQQRPFAEIELGQSLQSGQIWRDRLTENDNYHPYTGEALLESNAALPEVAELTERTDGSASSIPLPVMITIPAGRFNMGSPDGEPDRYDSEGPQREVVLPAFELAQTETTWAQWEVCEAAGVCEKLPRPEWLPADERVQHPVVNVTWDQAQAYVQWLNSSSDKDGGYRLPTEAEFEYAMRAGSTTPYHWGAESQCKYANGAADETDYEWKNRDCNDGYQFTAPVGSFASNAFDLRDMAGNAWEWTEDCWHENYTNAPLDASEWLESGGGDCGRRVLRGGGWSSKPQNLRSADRNRNNRDDANNSVGFRLARTPRP